MSTGQEATTVEEVVKGENNVEQSVSDNTGEFKQPEENNVAGEDKPEENNSDKLFPMLENYREYGINLHPDIEGLGEWFVGFILHHKQFVPRNTHTLVPAACKTVNKAPILPAVNKAFIALVRHNNIPVFRNKNIHWNLSVIALTRGAWRVVLQRGSEWGRKRGMVYHQYAEGRKRNPDL